jgi:hypothetical protein
VHNWGSHIADLSDGELENVYGGGFYHHSPGESKPAEVRLSTGFSGSAVHRLLTMPFSSPRFLLRGPTARSFLMARNVYTAPPFSTRPAATGSGRPPWKRKAVKETTRAAARGRGRPAHLSSSCCFLHWLDMRPAA